jgi:hypothetical protein
MVFNYYRASSLDTVFWTISFKKESITLTPPPENMKLFTGYTHKQLGGINSPAGYISQGYISKKNGVTIHYSIGLSPASTIYFSNNEKINWQIKQNLNGREVLVVRTEEEIHVIFPKLHARFYANAKTDEQMSTVLFMVLTYKDDIDSSKNN